MVRRYFSFAFLWAFSFSFLLLRPTGKGMRLQDFPLINCGGPFLIHFLFRQAATNERGIQPMSEAIRRPQKNNGAIILASLMHFPHPFPFDPAIIFIEIQKEMEMRGKCDNSLSIFLRSYRMVTIFPHFHSLSCSSLSNSIFTPFLILHSILCDDSSRNEERL